MKTLNDLNDSPEYAQVRQTVDALRADQQTIAARMDEIQLELSKPRQKMPDNKDAWTIALQGKNDVPHEIDVRSSLREEFELLEGRLRFVQEALSTGVMELDKIHGRVSREICQTIHRPAFVAQIRKILEHLKGICDANQELQRMRSELERDGLRTDSLPYGIFDTGGEWGDEYGGRVMAFQRHIAEHYPELIDPAGWAIKAKIASLAARQHAFEVSSNAS